MYSPAQLADALGVSLTTLRRYEHQGLIPDVPRTAGNHRCYTALHAQAFATVRALLKGCDIPVAYDAMRKLKAGETAQAFWLLNGQLHAMQEEKRRVEDVLEMVRSADWTRRRGKPPGRAMTIGEAAELAGVNASAIRHWEKEGLIRSARNPGNGYRLFEEAELRKIFIVGSLRKTVYSIEAMRELLNDAEMRSYAQIDRSFRLALHNLNRRLAACFEAVAQVVRYARMLEGGSGDDRPEG